ncbi:hypothetical protein Tco_0490354 [Tanacetum coccineum]
MWLVGVVVMRVVEVGDEGSGGWCVGGGVPAIDRSSPETRRKRGDDDIDGGSMVGRVDQSGVGRDRVGLVALARVWPETVAGKYEAPEIVERDMYV